MRQLLFIPIFKFIHLFSTFRVLLRKTKWISATFTWCKKRLIWLCLYATDCQISHFIDLLLNIGKLFRELEIIIESQNLLFYLLYLRLNMHGLYSNDVVEGLYNGID